MNLIYSIQRKERNKSHVQTKTKLQCQIQSDLVIEAIKGEKTINEIAAENNIQPNLLRNWKNEFLQNASIVFDEKRDENVRQKLEEERAEKAAYAKKVGQLTMQVDWLKKI